MNGNECTRATPIYAQTQLMVSISIDSTCNGGGDGEDESSLIPGLSPNAALAVVIVVPIVLVLLVLAIVLVSIPSTRRKLMPYRDRQCHQFTTMKVTFQESFSNLSIPILFPLLSSSQLLEWKWSLIANIVRLRAE